MECVFGIFMSALSTEVASFEGFGIERSVRTTAPITAHLGSDKLHLCSDKNPG